MLRTRLTTLALVLLLGGLLIGCQNGDAPVPAASSPDVAASPSLSTLPEPTVPTAVDESYPAPQADVEGYPAPQADVEGYPAPGAEGVSAATATLPELSGEADVVAAPFDVPAPSDNTRANIGGTLMRELRGSVTGPFQDVVLYLGQVVLSDDGRKVAAGFTEESPRTSTNQNGQFVFENVPPGEYAIFYWTPLGSVMLLEPETGNDMLFSLEAGGTVDVGPLAYDLPY